MEYGDRIALLRTEASMTQEELSGVIGITRAALSHYEKNRRQPEYKVLTSIADYFKVSVDWILHGNKLPIPSDPKYSDLGEITIEEEYARKGLTKEMIRHYLDAAALAVEEARKMHNKKVK